MTEAWVRALAERYGLDVLKRVTTGTERSGFATFELTGPESRIVSAWPAVAERGAKGFVQMRRSDVDGAVYIAVDSVYFDQGWDGGRECRPADLTLGVH